MVICTWHRLRFHYQHQSFNFVTYETDHGAPRISLHSFTSYSKKGCSAFQISVGSHTITCKLLTGGYKLLFIIINSRLHWQLHTSNAYFVRRSDKHMLEQHVNAKDDKHVAQICVLQIFV